MDPQWKNQNQAPGQPTEPGSSVPLSPPQTSVPPTPPDQPVDPAAFAAQNVYDTYDPNAKPPSSGRKIIVPIIVLALLALPAGAYFLVSSNQKQPSTQASQTPAEQTPPLVNTTQPVIANKQPAIPIDWKTLDTKLGYTIKIPADWAGGSSAPVESDFDIYKSTQITLGAFSDPSGKEALPAGKYISTGLESITTSKSKIDFEKAIVDVDLVAQVIGVDKSQVKATLSKINISGTEWMQVDSEIPGTFSRNLYLWVSDHTVFVSISSSSKATLDKYSNDYLYSVAASVKLK